MIKMEMQRKMGASFLCVKKSLEENLTSLKELKTVLQCLGLSPSDEDVEKIFKEKGISFSDYCNIVKHFPELNEAYISGLFSKCIQVNCGNIKMTEFVRAFGPLSKISDDGSSSNTTDANFSKDDTINLNSVISSIATVSQELKELSIKRYDKITGVASVTAPTNDLNSVLETISMDKDLTSWKSVSLKGSFFIEKDIIISHQYSFTVPYIQEYALIIKQRMSSNEYSSNALAFIFREENGERVFVGHTNRLTKDLYPVCHCTLNKGKYVVMPYSTECYSNKEAITKDEIRLIECNPNVALTSKFVKILNEIFNQIDLDCNNLLSRQEFNLYNWRTSGDIVEDEEWQAVLENFDVINGELSQAGFISLHQLEAEDCSGKTDDLWLALEAMGYNKQGNQVQAVHFEITLLCAIAAPNLIVSGLRSGGALLEDAYIQVIIDSATPSNIGDNKDILLYKNITTNRGTIIVKNMSEINYVIRIDCSSSINSMSHRQNLDFLVEIGKLETVIAHHLFPKDKNSPIKIIIKESIQSKYKRAHFTMRKTVFVTVGTTQFNELIDSVVKKQTLQLLLKNGYERVLLQIGKGNEPIMEDIPGLTLEWFRFKPSLVEDFSKADLIISHAGAGSCIEALGAGKPLVTVVNDKLMNNHQTELAETLSQMHYCKCCYPNTLHSTLAELDITDMAPYEPGNPKKFADFLDEMFIA